MKDTQKEKIWSIHRQFLSMDDPSLEDYEVYVEDLCYIFNAPEPHLELTPEDVSYYDIETRTIWADCDLDSITKLTLYHISATTTGKIDPTIKTKIDSWLNDTIDGMTLI